MRKQPLIPFDSPLYKILEYVWLIAGSFLVAVSFNLFLNPNQIASGGVAGISTILHHVFQIEPALTQWGFNIPLFIAGILLLGRTFGVKTAIGSLILPLFVLLTRSWEPLTDQLLLASIYGGIGVGLGLGLVFRGRGSTGGLDLVAQILHKYTGLSLALSIALLDGLVILTAGIVFSAEKAMYALIALFATSKTIDIVQLGFAYSKVAIVVSSPQYEQEIKQGILHELDRGLTRLSGEGGYTGDDKIVWMIVLSHHEVSKLKAIVQSIDQEAFVIISDTREVLGEGFKRTQT